MTRDDLFDNPVPTTATYALNIVRARRAKLFETVEHLAEHGPAAEALLAPFIAAVEAGDGTMWCRPNSSDGYPIQCDGDVAVLVRVLLQLAGWESKPYRGVVIVEPPQVEFS